VLDQIDRTYDAYVVAGGKVIAVAQQADDRGLMFEALQTAAESSKPLLDLGSVRSGKP
jgi:hypothetical protein